MHTNKMMTKNKMHNKVPVYFWFENSERGAAGSLVQLFPKFGAMHSNDQTFNSVFNIL